MLNPVFYFFSIVFLLMPVFPLVAETASSMPGLGYTQLWPVHAILMSLSFALMLCGMIVSRFFKKRRWWLMIHRCLQWTGGIIGIVGLATSIYMVSVSTGVHFRVLHSIFGLIVIGLIIFTPILGYSIFKVKPEKKSSLRLMHRWTGRTTLVLMAATIVMGLLVAGIL